MTIRDYIITPRANDSLPKQACRMLLVASACYAVGILSYYLTFVFGIIGGIELGKLKNKKEK